MSLDVLDWNIDPNQRWFVKLSDVDSQMRVELFNSAPDAQSDQNRVAFAEVAFGAAVPVTLTPDFTLPAYGEPLAKFNNALSYHLVASGEQGDPAKIFAIGPFTDLPGIEDPLMLTEEMIRARGALEINRGTHSRFYTSLTLARHYPELDEGAIVALSSSKRVLVQARQKIISMNTEIRIDESGEVRFFDVLETVEYLDFVRQ
jgi:hypothetical protein